ncbi:MAG: phosphatidylglycerophosphatase A [Methylophilales bacterium]|nr:phosphatidylglycerophosphatase A [Methylophilales bacterium]
MKPDFKFLLRHPAHYFALGFGSGLFPKAPGTAGSLAAIPLFLLIPASTLAPTFITLVLLFLFGVWCCDVTGKALGVSDHGSIVWDEMVAMWLILAFMPRTALWIGLGFLLFRLFDIWKPFPIRQCDAKLKGGFGVMFDDVLAAIYALIILKGLLWLS